MTDTTATATTPPAPAFQHMSDEDATAMGVAYMQRYVSPPVPGTEAQALDPAVEAKCLEIARYIELRYMTPAEIAEDYPDGIPEDPTGSGFPVAPVEPPEAPQA